MRILLIILALFVANFSSAQEKATSTANAEGILKSFLRAKGKPAEVTEPSKMLREYLLAECQKEFDRRRDLVMKLEKPDAIRKRQAELKAKFVEALGGFPEKTPLNAKLTGTIEGTGFTVEKVIYESQPQHHVTASLYLPKGKGPFPGVLMPCGHSANGKAADAYQRICMLLARNGFVVLSYDPIGQGERLQLLTDKNKAGIPGSTSEHTMVGVGALLVGRCTATYRIWDGIRSLDYLASRPEVDAKRLGCTGNSGGGTLTAYLMALDERIVAAAPSCYITSFERLFNTIGPQDGEQNIPGQIAFGMDHADYVTMRAPLPTLLCTGTQDFFDIIGSWATFREASLLYGKLGYGERVAMFEFNDKHGFSQPRREAATRWMLRWLAGKEQSVFEETTSIFTDEQLQCTRSGQVLEDYKGKSAFHMNVEECNRWASERAKFTSLPESDRKAKIRSLLGLEERIAPATIAWRKMVHTEDRLSTHEMVFQIEPGVYVPARRFKHIQPKKSAQIVLPDKGWEFGSKLPPALEKKYQDGHEILVLDVRGLGETSPAPIGWKQTYFGVDMPHAFMAQHLNRPLAIVQTVEANDVELSGHGLAGLVALHAAALEPRIRSVTTEKTLTRWEDVVKTPISFNQLSSTLHGVLKVYDLPELAKSLAPRTVTAVDPVNAQGQAIR